MASTANTYVTQTQTTDPGSGTWRDWSNISRITASNNSYATAALSPFTAPWTYYRTFYGEGKALGFSIPPATIDGIRLQFEMKDTMGSSNCWLNFESLMLNSTRTGTAKSGSQFSTTSDAFYTEGGSTDTWGRTWTPGDANSTGFGGSVQAGSQGPSSNPTVSFDSMRITVWYTELLGGAREYPRGSMRGASRGVA